MACLGHLGGQRGLQEGREGRIWSKGGWRATSRRGLGDWVEPLPTEGPQIPAQPLLDPRALFTSGLLRVPRRGGSLWGRRWVRVWAEQWECLGMRQRCVCAWP